MHRDITAANVFIKKKTAARMEVVCFECHHLTLIMKSNSTFQVLGDFGLAKNFVGRNAVKATCVGTPGYMAPEIQNRQKYSIEGELYSLGGVLYFMFTGDDPRHERKKVQLAKIRETQHHTAAELLESLWQEDPKLRIKLEGRLQIHVLSLYNFFKIWMNIHLFLLLLEDAPS